MAKQKLSTSDKIEAFSMRLNGSSLQEIADKFGVSRQCIFQIVPTGTSYRLSNNYESCIYPNIRRFLIENRYSYHRFADLCAVSLTCMHNALIGRVSPHKSTIDKILEVTGMTYEEAFLLCDSKDGEVL